MTQGLDKLIKTKIDMFRSSQPFLCVQKSDAEVVSIMMKQKSQYFTPREIEYLKQSLFLKNDGIGAMDNFESSSKANVDSTNNCPLLSDVRQHRQSSLKKANDNIQSEIASELQQIVEQQQEKFDYQVNVKDDIFAKTADVVSHVWSNPLSMKGNSSTVTKIRLGNAQSSANQLDGQLYKDTGLEGMDFRTGFKQLTGKEYSPTAAAIYLKNKQQYLTVARSEAVLNDLKKNCLFPHEVTLQASRLPEYSRDSHIEQAESTRVARKMVKRDDLKLQSTDGVLVSKKTEVIANFQKYLGLSEEQKKEITQKCKELGVDEFDFYKNMGESLVNDYEKQHKKLLKGKTVTEYKSKYNDSRQALFGSKIPIVEHVDDFCSSQDMGGSVTKGAAFIAMSVAGGAVLGSGILATGVSTAGASLGTDLISKSTNGVDNSVDMSSEELLKMGRSALINGAFASISASQFKKIFTSKTSTAIDKAKFEKHLFGGETTKMLASGTYDGVVELGKQIGKGENISTDKILAKATATAMSCLSGKFLGKTTNKFFKRVEGDAHIAWMKQNKSSIINELESMGKPDIVKQLKENPKLFDDYINQVASMINAA